MSYDLNMQTVIALALIIASGWNVNGYDGVIDITDPVGDTMTVNASCAAYLHNSGYDSLRDGINNLSGTRDYMAACF